MGKRYIVTEGQLEMLKSLLGEDENSLQAKQDIELIIDRQFIGESITPVVQDAASLKIFLKAMEYPEFPEKLFEILGETDVLSSL